MDLKKIIVAIATILVIIGGLNWLLYGINKDYNLVNKFFTDGTTLATLIYVLVGLGAIVMLLPLYEMLVAAPAKK